MTTNTLRSIALFLVGFLPVLLVGIALVQATHQPAQLKAVAVASCPMPGQMIDPCAKLDTSRVDDLR